MFRAFFQITQVLADSAFDEQSAQVAEWMSKEYACSYADALHPFLAPGQKVKVTRKDADSPWQLVCEKSGPVDERWAELTEKALTLRLRQMQASNVRYLRLWCKAP